MKPSTLRVLFLADLLLIMCLALVDILAEPMTSGTPYDSQLQSLVGTLFLGAIAALGILSLYAGLFSPDVAINDLDRFSGLLPDSIRLPFLRSGLALFGALILAALAFFLLGR